MNSWIRLTIVAIVSASLGCGDAGSSAPGSSGAEVPTPGSAVELGDPGPPPTGQTEPAPATAASGNEAAAGPVLPPPDDSAVPEPTSANEGSCDEPAAAAQVSVQVLDWAGVEKLIVAHKGKVVVVDLWSTSCIPCRREFPNLVQLQQELGDSVACISVSTDYDGIPSKPPESYREKVLTFLTKQNASFENVLSSVAAEDLFNQLKIGSIPAVFVYDRNGKRVKVFADPIEGEEFTYADHIRPFVESLLRSR